MHWSLWVLFGLLVVIGFVQLGDVLVKPSPVARAAFWFSLAALLVSLAK